MDFNDAPQEAEFRAVVRAWLNENATEYRDPPPEGIKLPEFIARSKAWQAKKHAAGYTGITWPKMFGGQGLTPMHSIIYGQEESRWHVPQGLYSIGLGMCIPTVFTHGNPEVVQRYVRGVDEQDVQMCVRSEANIEMLEMNINLPDEQR